MDCAPLKHRIEIAWLSPLPSFCKVYFATALCLLITLGCAENISLYQREAFSDSKKVIINNVPFVKQKPNYCGPATLATVFNFWGIHITQDEIAKEVYSPELKGALSIEMALYTVRKGFEVEMYNGTFQDIKEKIETGFPLIVSYRTHKGQYKVHYMVIKGFDDNKEVVYAHSGKKENQKIGYKSFLKHWGWADNLTFFIYPKVKEGNGYKND